MEPIQSIPKLIKLIDSNLEIPVISTEQMREVDRLMVGEFGIDLIQMMENAGRNLADFVKNRLHRPLKGAKILVLCGTGNNGGGGMVSARHLHNWGGNVSIFLVGEKGGLKPIPHHQWNIIEHLGINKAELPDPIDFDLIVDAVIGYGLMGSPRQDIGALIEIVNQSAKPVISLDAPTGLNTTSGPSEWVIRAEATLTLALPKIGLFEESSRLYIGELYLADIGVPNELYESIHLHVPVIFGQSQIVRIY